MTRQQAIANIIQNWQQADSEFCGSNEELQSSFEDMRKSLLALGVSNEEFLSFSMNVPRGLVL